MDDLIAFVTARLDEDERYAHTMIKVGERKAAKATPEDYADVAALAITVLSDPQARDEIERWADGKVLPPNDLHRVLSEVEAKRAILAEHASSGGMYPTCMRCARWEPGTWYGDEEDGEEPPDGMSSVSYPCRTVRLLAAVYSDHPDYRQEWAVS